MHQLDIFADSRDRVLINRLAEALCAADIEQAQIASVELTQEFPTDRHLPSTALLIDTLAREHRLAAAPLRSAPEAAAAREHLLAPVHEAALEVLGAGTARLWLAQRWQALARRAAGLPFDAQSPAIHASALWLQGGAWAEAEQAALAIESWRRKPAPLAWVAQARWHLQGPDAVWPLLAEVAWLAPQRLAALLALLPDQSVHKWARAFEAAALDDTDAAPDWRWWPAWLLVEQPLLAVPLQAALTDSEHASVLGFTLVKNLLRAERQGRHHDLMALRKQLQSLKPALFVAYMATR